MDRIKELVNYIESYEYLADVGCDHGYLIVEAFKKYNLKQAIAIDNKKGPLSQAIENIKNYDFNSKVIYSLSSGIKEINELTDVVVIAGMGGMLISDILNDDLKNVNRLILQPNRDIKEVRMKINNIGFKIVSEKIVLENDKYYEIIVCDRTNETVSYSDDELEFGPMLLQERNPLFIEKWKKEIIKLEKIKNNTTVIEQLDQKIERIKKVICL